MIIGHQVRLPGEEHLLKLFDIGSHAKDYVPVSIEQFQRPFERSADCRGRPVFSKMDGPSLSCRDRVLHQGVTRLEVLCSSQMIGLPLHFLHLSTLSVGLRPRVNKGDGRENRTRNSGQHACIDVHALVLSRLKEICNAALSIQEIREVTSGGQRKLLKICLAGSLTISLGLRLPTRKL